MRIQNKLSSNEGNVKDLFAAKIYEAAGYTDLRKEIDSLSRLEQGQFHLDLYKDMLFPK